MIAAINNEIWHQSTHYSCYSGGILPKGPKGDTIDKNTRTSVIIAFCETIRSAGYTAGIYANKTWLTSRMDVSKFGNYKIWVAHYSSVCGYTGRYDYWQYTEKGTVSGINGNVDMDLRYS